MHSVSYASSLDMILGIPMSIYGFILGLGGANSLLFSLIIVAGIWLAFRDFLFSFLGASGVLYILAFLLVYGLVI